MAGLETDAVPRTYGIFTPLLRGIWLRFLASPSVCVVAVLDDAKRDLERRFSVSSEVIPHAVPEEFFRAGSSARDPSAAGPLRMIFVGELSERKGVRRLLALHEEASDLGVHTTIVGDGPLRETCVKAEAELDHLRFLGPIRDRGQLADEMSKHDVLVLLSRRDEAWEELFGIVIVEAIAAGLGVIATNHVGPVQILGSGWHGLFDESDEAGPRQLIRDLAGCPAERDAFRQAHRGLADRFRMDVIEAEWQDALRRAASRT